MARRKKQQFIPRLRKKQIDLEIQETSETGTERSSSASRKEDYDEYVKVPPPFKGENSNKAITWSDLSYTWKIGAVIGSLFLAVGVPSVWFASKMDSKVDNIETDVREIKQTTKNLTEASIKNSSKIQSIERFLDHISGNTAAQNE